MTAPGLQLVGDSKLDGKLVEGHVKNETAKVERGTLGNLFGSPSNIPGNIAALIAVAASTALIFVVVYWSGSTDFTHKDGITSLSALVTLAVGYLFGKASKA